MSQTGVVMVARQAAALGRIHAGKTVTVDITDTGSGYRLRRRARTVRRTNTLPIRNLKADRPSAPNRTAT